MRNVGLTAFVIFWNCLEKKKTWQQIDPLYISEMTPAAHRGRLVTWSEMAINVGIVLGFCSGLVFYNVDENLEWRLMFGMGAILPMILIVVSEFVMAESPRWLVSKGRHEEAKVILQKIYPEGRYMIWEDLGQGLFRGKHLMSFFSFSFF